MLRVTSKPNGKAKSAKPTPLNANAVTVADRRDALFHKWPIRYDQRFAEMAEKMVRYLGATEREVATCIGIPEWKLKDWKKEHPEFVEALREARAAVDAEVATRLYQRAMGYEQRATKMFPVTTSWYEPDAEGKPQRQSRTDIVEREYVEYHPPDTDAAKFWLKNRQPTLWREISHREERSEQVIAHVVVEAREEMTAMIDAVAQRIEESESSTSQRIDGGASGTPAEG